MKHTLKSINESMRTVGMMAIRRGGGAFEILLMEHQARIFNPAPEKEYKGSKRGDNGLYCCICECNTMREVVGFFNGVVHAKLLIASGVPLSDSFSKAPTHRHP